ncbi:SFH1 [Malassezia furfur]|nr:SFH1 [Malassezia furfur]
MAPNNAGWVLGTTNEPMLPQAPIARAQAMYSTYASQMRAGTTTLMQPIVRNANDDALERGERGDHRGRYARAVYYGEDATDDDDDLDSNDEEYGASRRKRQSVASDARATHSPDTHGPGDVEGESELRPPGSQLGVPVPRNRLVVRPARRTPHAYFSDAQLTQHAGGTEVLVPIRIEFHTDTHRIKDVFLWNLHERLITPYQFAQVFLQDLALPLTPYAYPLPTAEEPAAAAAAAAAAAPEPPIAFVQDVAPRDSPAPERDAAAAAPADPKAAEKARVRETLASVDAEDDLRVIVDVRDELTQYEVQILRHMLRDRLEWDLTSPLTPEAFAQSLTRDLGLSTESTVLISHAVREQLLRHRRAALELGLFGSGKIYRCTMDELVERRAAEAASALDPDASVRDEVGDVVAPPNTRSRRLAAGAAAAADTSLSVPFLVPDKTLPLAVRKEQALATLRDLLALGPRPLEGVWRDFHDAPDFGPLLEFLSEAEMEKMEEADMRASRRSRRDAQRAGRARR